MDAYASARPWRGTRTEAQWMIGLVSGMSSFRARVECPDCTVPLHDPDHAARCVGNEMGLIRAVRQITKALALPVLLTAGRMGRNARVVSAGHPVCVARLGCGRDECGCRAFTSVRFSTAATL